MASNGSLSSNFYHAVSELIRCFTRMFHFICNGLSLFAGKPLRASTLFSTRAGKTQNCQMYEQKHAQSIASLIDRFHSRGQHLC